MNSDLYYIHKLINGDNVTTKNQETTFDIIRHMTAKEKNDVCKQQVTHAPVEGCSVAGMSINDCLKCPISTINTSHLLYSIWHDNMVEIGYLKR